MLPNLLVISDPHCGHRGGLTPPSWQRQSAKKIGELGVHMWAAFDKSLRDAVKKVGPFSRIACLGDIIDGRGERSGGTELLTTSQVEQISIFNEVMAHVRSYCTKTVKLWVVKGTAYHTAYAGEDWEDLVAKDKTVARLYPACVHVDGHGQADINGTIFDLRHHCGSNVYWTRGSALNREHMNNVLWTDSDLRAPAHVILRGHTHYFDFKGNRRWLGLTCPTLSWGSKYGILRCGNPIDWGITYFWNIGGGDYEWGYDIKFIDDMKLKPMAF